MRRYKKDFSKNVTQPMALDNTFEHWIEPD